MMSEQFDLIVLGAGPAGLSGAMAGGIFGKRVALVERSSRVGGALINTGTLPSKTLRETALALSGVRSRRLYGVDLSLRREATVAELMFHERQVGQGERERIGTFMDELAITVVSGTGRFLDGHTIEVTGPDSPARVLVAERILIATGSSPVRPPIFPFDHPQMYDSDKILELDRIPASLAVVGAGTIGAEYACTFNALGVKVSLIDGRNELLPFLDREVSANLCKAMAASGITFAWNERVNSCSPRSTALELTLSSGATLTTEAVLIAAGRYSNTAHLNLPAAGVETGDKGLIKVDATYRSSAESVYAAGDAIGPPALAATGAEQARIAVCNAFHVALRKRLAPILPTGIYTIPEAGSIGQTEEQVKAAGIEYVVGRASYRDNPRGAIIGDRNGLLKLIFARDDLRLLGVHAVGEQATELVHVGMMVMLCGGGGAQLNTACFNVPTLGDLYKTATYNALIQMAGGQLPVNRPAPSPAPSSPG